MLSQSKHLRFPITLVSLMLPLTGYSVTIADSVILYTPYTKICISPGQLYSDATTTLLVPSLRIHGPLTNNQIAGAIPEPLPLGQTLFMVRPQIAGLLASTILCFVLSYISFMKKEIRSR